MSEPCLYFGCWNEAGHYLFAPGGRSVRAPERDRIELFGYVDRVLEAGRGIHLDGSLAPRVKAGVGVVYAAQGATKDARSTLTHRSSECPEGQFLRHELDNGYTAIQWWDRHQGDTRGACNSTILLAGKHTSAEVLAAGRASFPHVFDNLLCVGPVSRGAERRKPGDLRPVELVEVFPA